MNQENRRKIGALDSWIQHPGEETPNSDLVECEKHTKIDQEMTIRAFEVKSDQELENTTSGEQGITSREKEATSGHESCP